MLSPEEQEMHIRMVKDSLSKMNMNLSDEVSVGIELDKETETLLKDLKTLSQEILRQNDVHENEKQTNLKLLAQRMELKRKCAAIGKEFECMQKEAATNAQLCEERRLKKLQSVKQYEQIMFEKAKEMRDMALFYETNEAKKKIKETKMVLQELNKEYAELEENIEKLKDVMENITCDVPSNIMDIVGKKELEEYLQNLDNEIVDLKKELKK